MSDAVSPAADNGTVTPGRRQQRIGLRRLLGLAAFLPLASRAPIYGRLFLELVIDDRTPVGRKAMLAGALGYLVLGRDIVPDDLPIIGGLDDLVVVVLAVDLFLDGVPSDVLDEKLDLLGIDRRSFMEDVARIRRFTPAPLRRAIRGAPRALAFAGDTLDHSRLGPRVRAWINKEGSIA
ncbi:MAG TPA: YkvA family protein [Candidatus Limnocylindrales bacterium]